MAKCDCDERTGVEINSLKQFEEYKSFFEERVRSRMFEEVDAEVPYYVGRGSKGNCIKWYTDKWYRCNCCRCIWEYI